MPSVPKTTIGRALGGTEAFSAFPDNPTRRKAGGGCVPSLMSTLGSPCPRTLTTPSPRGQLSGIPPEGQGIKLRPYQVEGVKWMVQCYKVQHGCILGDEMGLGKTCQTISLLLYLTKEVTNKEKFLILCPLSVLSNWKEELERFAPGLSFVTYIGSKEERPKLQQNLKEQSHFHAILTTYEFSVGFSLLLTGTPIQNSLQELYSLLSLVEPDIFPREQAKEFVDYYQAIEKESEPAKELHNLLQPFLLRRVKSEVAAELPKKVEVVLYHGMSALQRKYYKAILMKDLGGVGMNLTAADTVIFTDSDFNPQNDLQAIARAHRIGQNKSNCTSITFLLIVTVDFVLAFLSLPKEWLSEILKFGLDKLLSSEGSTTQDVELENILGETKEGKWVMDVVLPHKEESEEEDTENHMYVYEGKDYSKEPSREDKKAFDQLLDLQKALTEETSTEGRALRNKANALLTGLREQSTRRKHLLSAEELEARRKKRQEAAAKRARLMEEKKKAKAEAEHTKKMAWWEENHYTSTCLPSEESDSEEEFEEEEVGLNVDLDYKDADLNCIKYVMGDVTHPKAEEEDAIIVHCLGRTYNNRNVVGSFHAFSGFMDDSGRWGRGGLFTALEARSDQPRKIYEMAGKMKDLELGGTLLFPIDDKKSRKKGRDLLALIVAQHRDRSNNLSGIKLSALEKGLKKIYLAAKKRNATVHLPRIGYATKGFNWYGTERLIRKHLATRGIPTLIYYFPRNKGSSASQPYSSSATVSKP
ncbi:chromodomain-helicase-dna-binding protein 1-like [Limosa lapponica baueri]|uniref:Chromodomain-helicase-dna-binding protein 1-like n=1 Tax=Limosa lapponica baueri TaxID=1758121 RepID=A0A2I0TRQ2_LIMLA|nr:chromodomain-helicase-dna-binding protein 1-like [Limosa lapponica baueri]